MYHCGETTFGDSYDVLMQWEALPWSRKWREGLPLYSNTKMHGLPSECPHTCFVNALSSSFWKPISRQLSPNWPPSLQLRPFLSVPQRPPWRPLCTDCLISLHIVSVLCTWHGSWVLDLKPGSQPLGPGWSAHSGRSLGTGSTVCWLIQESKPNHCK